MERGISCVADFDSALARFRNANRWINAFSLAWLAAIQVIAACDLLNIPCPVSWKLLAMAVIFVPLPVLVFVGRARQVRFGLVCPFCKSPLIKGARSEHLIRTTGRCCTCEEQILRDSLDYTIPEAPHVEPIAQMPRLNSALAIVGVAVLAILPFLSNQVWFTAEARHLTQAIGFMSSILSLGVGLYGMIRYGSRFRDSSLIGGISTVIWLWLMCNA